MRSFVMCAVAVAMALLLPACGGGTSADSSAAGAATFVFARGADSKRLDPISVSDGESVKVIEQVFDTLIRFDDASADLKPALATEWKPAAGDAKTWEFTLRQGVKFHDGTPFNADAVVATFERAMDLGALGKAGVDHKTKSFFFTSEMREGKEVESRLYEKVEKIDDFHVRFRLAEPYTPFLSLIASYPSSILPPSARQPVKEFGQKPVGTGPYAFVSWKEAQKTIILKRNEGYWRGKPAFEQVVFKSVDDNKSRLIQLEKGEVDAMDGIVPLDRGRIRANKDLTLIEGTPLSICYLAMNTQHESGHFADPNVRQAVALAIDLDPILRLYDGTAAAAATPLPPAFAAHAKGLKPRARDMAAAKAALARSKFPNGFETTFFYMIEPRPYLDKPADVAQVIASQVEAVGIKVKLAPRPFHQGFLEGVMKGEHEMCILGWTADFPDPDNFLYVLLSGDMAKAPSANNVSFYDVPEVNDLLRRARVEPDEAKRSELYRQVQERVYADAPMIPLVYPGARLACRKNVRGLVVHPVGSVRLFPVSKD